MDDAIRRRIWQGKLNIEVSLASSSKTNSSNGSRVPKYYLQVYRNSYLPLYYDSMLQFFEPYIGDNVKAVGRASGDIDDKESDVKNQKRNADNASAKNVDIKHDKANQENSETSTKNSRNNTNGNDNKIQDKDTWLSFEDIPLKWNYPIGLLYDYLNYDAVSDQNEPTSSTATAPAVDKFWKLTLHFEDYPLSQLIPLQSPLRTTIEQYWVNQIKESCYVQHNSAKPVMNLSKKDSDAMWQYAQNCDYDKFKSIYFRKIVPRRAIELKNVPVKVYLPFSEKNIVIMDPVRPVIDEGYDEDGSGDKNSNNGNGNGNGSNNNTDSYSNDNGKVVTLHKLLERHLPDLFAGGAKGDQGGGKSIGKALIQGVEVPLQAPLGELYYAMMSIDGFLHVCVAVGGG